MCRVTRMLRRVTVHRLVDRVVERFPDEMMQAGAADAADVHAGALANGLEPLEDGNVFGCVIRCHGVKDYKALKRLLLSAVPLVFFPTVGTAGSCDRWRRFALSARAFASTSVTSRVDDLRSAIGSAITSRTRRRRFTARRVIRSSRLPDAPTMRHRGARRSAAPNTRRPPCRSRSRRSRPSFWHARIRVGNRSVLALVEIGLRGAEELLELTRIHRPARLAWSFRRARGE